MTPSTCCCVSIPGGPSFNVSTSMRGPSCMRSGSQASSMARVTASLELGLTTRILLIGLTDQQSQQSGTDHVFRGPEPRKTWSVPDLGLLTISASVQRDLPVL